MATKVAFAATEEQREGGREKRAFLREKQWQKRVSTEDRGGQQNNVGDGISANAKTSLASLVFL